MERSELVEAPPRRRTALIVSVCAGVVAALLVGVLATRPTGERLADSPLIDELVPPVVGTSIDGSPFDIDDHRGQWVVVNFFATWCAPCRIEHPELVAFSAAHAEVGDASVVSVAFDDEADAIRDFFEKEGGDWPVLVADTGPTVIDFGVTGVPESYLVAPDGTVVAKWVSGVTAEGLDDTIAELESRAGASS